MRVLFFTGAAPIGAMAFDLASSRFPEHDWRKLVLDTPERRAAFEAEDPPGELLISFLNPYIVPARLLERVGGRAYNVHPAPPDYPGNDPQHFAYYDGRRVAGATLHVMEPSVDSGPICAVAERPLEPGATLSRVRELSAHLALSLLLDALPALLDGSMRTNGRRWTTANRHSRADFQAMCRIDPQIDAEELRRRLAAFHQPGYRNQPYVELHGAVFVYDPERSAGT